MSGVLGRRVGGLDEQDGLAGLQARLVGEDLRVEGGLPPVELDPVTLETLRVWDFGARLRNDIDPNLAKLMGVDAPDGKVPGTFTAHPKIDPETGEMLGFGYGALPPYLTYRVVSAAGELVRSEFVVQRQGTRQDEGHEAREHEELEVQQLLQRDGVIAIGRLGGRRGRLHPRIVDGPSRASCSPRPSCVARRPRIRFNSAPYERARERPHRLEAPPRPRRRHTCEAPHGQGRRVGLRRPARLVRGTSSVCCRPRMSCP